MRPMTPITFGTSGWRAIIADEFTFANVRLLAHAIAETLIESGGGARPLAIGYDTRFQSERFAEEAARVLAARGLRCLMSATPIPTPALAHAIRHHKLAGAINITASHNPAEWNGVKFSTDRGAPSPPDLTRMVEAKAAAIAASPEADEIAAPPQGPPPPEIAERIETADFKDPYITQIDGLVRFDIIEKAGIKLALDVRWGAGRGYYDEILKRHGIPHHVIHDQRDVTFGGTGPDVSEKHLRDLSRTVTDGSFSLGLACDGDADRFGVVDADGRWVNPNLLLALLSDYLAESRGFRQGLGRTYATTGLIDAVARHYNVPVYQTPVGFKYLGEQILDCKVYLAGEESAGMSILGHVPEKDGLLGGLLAAEMVAARGRTVFQQRDDLFAKVGTLLSAREDFTVTHEQTARLRAHMQDPPAVLAGRKVARTTVLDGLRLDFDDGSWLLMRPSGTEPVVRYYVEAPTQRDLDELKAAGKGVLIGGKP